MLARMLPCAWIFVDLDLLKAADRSILDAEIPAVIGFQTFKGIVPSVGHLVPGRKHKQLTLFLFID